VARETINGEPGETWTNNTSRALYQFHAMRGACGACMQYDGQIGPKWPIQLHRNCRCQQSRIEPGARAPRAFIDFRAKLAEASHADKVRAVGASVYNLLERGVIKWEDAVTRARVRSLQEVVALKKLSVKTLEENGVRPWIAKIAHAAVHTPEQDLVRAAREASARALEAAGVNQEHLIEALAKTLTGRVKIVGGATVPGITGVTPVATTAGFRPAMSAGAKELESILINWRALGAAAIVAVGADSITIRRGAVTTTVRPGQTKYGKTYEEWRRIAEER
jgi:hypothetical protein